MPTYKTQSSSTTVGSAISDACSELQQLAEECREICDNMPDTLQQTDRYSALDDSASNLESIQEPDVPDHVADNHVSYTETVPTRRNYAPSRTIRRDNAVSMLSAAQSAIEEIMEKLEKHFEDDEVTTSTEDEARDHHDELGQLHSDIQEIIDSAECCDFPGMRG